MSELPDSALEHAARAVRMKNVWHTHRDKLADMAMPSAYNRTTRDTLARAVRALIFAMDRAQEGPDAGP